MLSLKVREKDYQRTKPIKIIISGFPHTATTRLYVELCRLCKDYDSNCMCFFEPFNYEVVRDYYKHGTHKHYRVGNIISDYDRIPERLFRKIVLNAREFYDYPFKDIEFLGSNGLEILDNLLYYGSVVIKDVHIWCLLPLLTRKYERALFVIPVREPQYTLNSFLRIHNITRLSSRLEKEKIKKLYNPIRLFKAIKRTFWIWRHTNIKDLWGLGIFYKFFGYEPPRGLSWIVKKEVFIKLYFGLTYSIYMHYAMLEGGRNNVFVYPFHDKLYNEDIEEIIQWVSEWFRIGK